MSDTERNYPNTKSQLACSSDQLRPTRDRVGPSVVEHRVTLSRVPESVSVARERVRRVLGDHPLLDNVLLVTSEFVTNAVVHAVGPCCDLVIENRCPRVVVHVMDYGGTGEPRLSAPGDPFADHGRGLAIVRMLATLTWERSDEGTLTMSAVLPKADVDG